MSAGGSDDIQAALQRFLKFCRFEAETGCGLWAGGQTKGRGHHVPYGAFWFDGRRWGAHRWAAKYIHGLEITDLQVDHCCPHIPRPNTLCVEHVQALTLLKNRELQHRRTYVHLQVGLVSYEEVYGPVIEPEPQVPFFYEPPWLKAGADYGRHIIHLRDRDSLAGIGAAVGHQPHQGRKGCEAACQTAA